MQEVPDIVGEETITSGKRGKEASPLATRHALARDACAEPAPRDKEEQEGKLYFFGGECE